MSYSELLKKLDKWIRVIQKSIIVLAIIETVIVLFIGIASNKATDDQSPQIWTTILFILGILYVFITLFKIAYNKSFPSSITDELQSRKNLELCERDINRKEAINEYIASTIVSLRKCRCEIPKKQGENDWKELSDKDFKNGIIGLTSTFNNVLNIILNTSNIKFTTGIYVESIRAIKMDNDPVYHGGVYLMRDDFNLDSVHPMKDIFTDTNLTGSILIIQNNLKSSFNNGSLHLDTFSTKNNSIIQMISSNITDLNDSETQKGVLFILTNRVNPLPNDLESILQLFSVIVSHWLDLYEHKVVGRQIEHMGDDSPDENT